MFVIYANSELEQKQFAKKPEDYRVKDSFAKAVFRGGCEVIEEESRKFQQISCRRQEMTHCRVKKLHMGRE